MLQRTNERCARKYYYQIQFYTKLSILSYTLHFLTSYTFMCQISQDLKHSQCQFGLVFLISKKEIPLAMGALIHNESSLLHQFHHNFKVTYCNQLLDTPGFWCIRFQIYLVSLNIKGLSTCM